MVGRLSYRSDDHYLVQEVKRGILDRRLRDDGVDKTG